MKIESRTLRTIILGAIGGAVLGSAAAYVGFADHSPYGRKTSFLPSHYKRVVNPEDLHPQIRDAYFKGYASEDLIIGILDGRITNTASIESRKRYYR